MRSAGFDYQPTDSTSVPAAPPLTYDPNWGPLDVNVAAKNGYSPNSSTTVTGPDGQPVSVPSGIVLQPTPESDTDRARSEAMDSASGTCSDQAYQQLGMSGSEWTGAWDAVDNVQGQADNSALLDVKVTSAVQAWSACMAQQGYSYKTPQDAMSAPWGLTPDQNELNTAQADAQCKVQVNLMGTINQVTFDYEQKAVNANLPAVQHLQQLGLAAVQKAEAVLAQQPK